MNINEQIKIIEAYRDGAKIKANNKDSDKWVEFDPEYNELSEFYFNFQGYNYEIIPRELKHTWQPMGTMPKKEELDFFLENGEIISNLLWGGIGTVNAIAWMDPMPPPEWMDDE